MSVIIWINQYSAVLMLLVTLVYVVATIFIYKANNGSVKTANKQIVEMRRQYDDEKRMKLMPYFIVKVIDKTDQINGSDICYLEEMENKDNEAYLAVDIYFEIQNLGHDIAKECEYQWIGKDNSCRKRYRIISLAVGEKRILKVNFRSEACKDGIQYVSAACSTTYKDLLDNEYEQICNITFEINATEIKYITHGMTVPIWAGEKCYSSSRKEKKRCH